MATQVPQQGFGQQTPAVQTIIRAGMGMLSRARSSTRRKKSSRTSTSKKRKKSAGSSRKRSTTLKRLVKGSAAAKRYMAKIRKLRK